MSEQEPLMLEMEGLVSERLVYGDQPHELSVTYLNPFYEGQIRQTYNQDAKVELADSLLENNMLHPLTVAELDVLETIEYANDINELWSANYSIDNLTSNQNGEYFIVIAGHRRLLSIYYNNERSGVDDEQVFALCNIRQGIGLTEALRLQFTENAGRAEVSQSRDALAIRMYFMRR
ncbi:MAG TPA: hypothetical protein VF996_01705, partial [Candidatus Saccharimonadales bacterium]